MIEINGTLSPDYDVLRDQADLTTLSSHRVRLDREMSQEDVDLLVSRLADVLVTSCYLPIDLRSGRLMTNQSYHDIATWFPDARPRLEGDTFSLKSDPVVIDTPHVLVGGPIDGVWYHWLASWCARIAILKMVRPDLFADPAVRFLICNEANRAQFRETLLAMGVAEDRLSFVSHGFDYVLKDAILVTFPDQRYLYPEVVRSLSSTLREHFLEPAATQAIPRRRIFASRQGLDRPKRRIHNWTDISPVLQEFGFEIVELGKQTAQTQIQMFAEAEFIVGVHGSDLANLMFCSSDATVLVIENARNIYHGMSASLDVLAGIAGARYNAMVVEEFIDPETDYSSFPTVHNRDVVVPEAQFRDQLIAMGCQPL